MRSRKLPGVSVWPTVKVGGEDVNLLFSRLSMHVKGRIRPPGPVLRA